MATIFFRWETEAQQGLTLDCTRIQIGMEISWWPLLTRYSVWAPSCCSDPLLQLTSSQNLSPQSLFADTHRRRGLKMRALFYLDSVR